VLVTRWRKGAPPGRGAPLISDHYWTLPALGMNSCCPYLVTPYVAITFCCTSAETIQFMKSFALGGSCFLARDHMVLVEKSLVALHKDLELEGRLVREICGPIGKSEPPSDR